MKPVTSTGYEPDFDIDLRRGQAGERLVSSFFEQLTGSTVEVKTDFGAWRTGNHYVETWQRSSTGDWRPSGLNATRAEWWCVVGPAGFGFLAIRCDELRRIAAQAPEAEQPVSNNRTNASRGRLVKVAAIARAALERAPEPEL